MAMKCFSEKNITYLHCWWECKLVQVLWKTVWRFLKKLKIGLLYDQVIPLLGIYPEKNVCTYTHTLEYYSAIKNNEIMPFAATQMDLEIIILNEVRKRKQNTIWYHLYVESKIQEKSTYLQNKNRFIYREQTCGCQEGGERNGSLGLAEVNYYTQRMGKQQGPAV